MPKKDSSKIKYHSVKPTKKEITYSGGATMPNIKRKKRINKKNLAQWEKKALKDFKKDFLDKLKIK